MISLPFRKIDQTGVGTEYEDKDGDEKDFIDFALMENKARKNIEKNLNAKKTAAQYLIQIKIFREWAKQKKMNMEVINSRLPTYLAAFITERFQGVIADKTNSYSLAEKISASLIWYYRTIGRRGNWDDSDPKNCRGLFN